MYRFAASIISYGTLCLQKLQCWQFDERLREIKLRIFIKTNLANLSSPTATTSKHENTSTAKTGCVLFWKNSKKKKNHSQLLNRLMFDFCTFSNSIENLWVTLTKKNFPKVGTFAQLQKLITFAFSFTKFIQLSKLVPKIILL